MRPKQKRTNDSAAKALNEIRQMHKDWKKKLEAETVEGELSEEGS